MEGYLKADWMKVKALQTEYFDAYGDSSVHFLTERPFAYSLYVYTLATGKNGEPGKRDWERGIGLSFVCNSQSIHSGGPEMIEVRVKSVEREGGRIDQVVGAFICDNPVGWDGESIENFLPEFWQDAEVVFSLDLRRALREQRAEASEPEALEQMRERGEG